MTSTRRSFLKGAAAAASLPAAIERALAEAK